MPTYWLVDNPTGRIESMTITDRPLDPQKGKTALDGADVPDAQLGYIYDFRAHTVSPPPTKPVRIITAREFIRRFTDAEIAQYETLTVAATQQGAQLRAAKTVLNAAPIVDLDHTDTLKYLGFMKDAGIITDRRIAEIRA